MIQALLYSKPSKRLEKRSLLSDSIHMTDSYKRITPVIKNAITRISERPTDSTPSLTTGESHANSRRQPTYLLMDGITYKHKHLTNTNSKKELAPRSLNQLLVLVANCT